jgi:hypothetical protein
VAALETQGTRTLKGVTRRVAGKVSSDMGRTHSAAAARMRVAAASGYGLG